MIQPHSEALECLRELVALKELRERASAIEQSLYFAPVDVVELRKHLQELDNEYYGRTALAWDKACQIVEQSE